MSPTPSTSRSVLFLLASARESGNAEQLARRAAEALPSGTVVEWLQLAQHLRQPFQDFRHEPGKGYPKPLPELLALAERTMAADELVIVSPIYWYHLTSTAQHYFEHWSWWMRLPELRFRERMRGKVLSLVTAHSSEEDDAVAQPPIQSLQLTAGYMGLRWRGALIGHGSAPGQVLTDTRALDAAREFLVRPVATEPQAA
ncbi:flavodoxin family protein [Pyxidicoccus sp. 3LFB2]